MESLVHNAIEAVRCCNWAQLGITAYCSTSFRRLCCAETVAWAIVVGAVDPIYYSQTDHRDQDGAVVRGFLCLAAGVASTTGFDFLRAGSSEKRLAPHPSAWVAGRGGALEAAALCLKVEHQDVVEPDHVKC